MKNVTFLDGVARIEKNAFKDCASLTNIEIPYGAVAIERGAFSNCTSLKTVTLPDTLLRIGSDTFEGCNFLENPTVPKRTRISDEVYNQKCMQKRLDDFWAHKDIIDFEMDYNLIWFDYLKSKRVKKN